jgi:CRISPR-associated endoribonuclease Cas6
LQKLTSKWKTYNFFTFSRIFGKFLKKEKGFLYFSPYFSVYFASPVDFELSPLRNRLIFEENLSLGENPIDVLSVDRVFVKIPDEVLTVKTLSPVIVYKKNPQSGGLEFLNPSEKDFFKILKENLNRKYFLWNRKPLEENVEIQPIEVKPQKIFLKGQALEAYRGLFKISAPKEVLKFIFETGLGGKNTEGFGMVLPKN